MNELIQIGLISPLRQRLIDDMTMRRFSRETQRNYLRDVGRFATWLGRSPHTASAEEVRQFQIHQQQAGVPAPTLNSIVSALRFLFTHTLDRPDLARKLVRTRQVRKIPVVLTMAEVKRLLDATRSLKHQGAAARSWLEAREADLLAVGYFHVVFTLPAEIAAIAYYNKALVYDLLFKAAADTMLTIAADPRHLGARIGITAVLHTWGSALTHHPHIHMIVPGGGISRDGTRWISASRTASDSAPIRDTGVVTRHGLAQTRSRAAPRLEADPLAPVLPKSRRRFVKIGPSAFARPLSRLKNSLSALRCVRFWAAPGYPTNCAKQLSP
jgi:hypothetical protein